MTTIIGAGLAGLLAGNIFRDAQIFEAGPETQISHKAVLRFRTPAVGNVVGIDFKNVTVNKGIYCDGEYVQPSILMANLYSKKVINRLADRSIWKQEPVERFIAPENLIEQLAGRCKGRLNWNAAIYNPDFSGEPTISTIPMPALARMLASGTEQDSIPQFQYAPISVQRWRIPGAAVFQTIYFPDPCISLYRASITGDLLIAEFMNTPDLESVPEMLDAFGLDAQDVIALDNTKQRYGKIAPIEESWRRNFILQTTLKHNIFSVGRFATWRNILLDDVLHDLQVVKRLISGGMYDSARIA